MTYDVKKKMKMAVSVLEKDEGIVTELQVYGQVGVSHKYWRDIMKKDSKFQVIENLLNKNKAKGSICVSNSLREQFAKGNVRAMELYGKITDPEMKDAWSYSGRQEAEEDDKSQSAPIDILTAEIRKIIEENGFSG